MTSYTEFIAEFLTPGGSVRLSDEDRKLNAKLALEALRTADESRRCQGSVAAAGGRVCALGVMGEALGVEYGDHPAVPAANFAWAVAMATGIHPNVVNFAARVNDHGSTSAGRQSWPQIADSIESGDWA